MNHDDLRAKLAAATPLLPVTLEDFGSYVTINRGQFDIASGRHSGMGVDRDRAIAAYIVAACNALPGLLDEIKTYRERMESLRPCLEVYEGGWQVKSGWPEEFWGSIAEIMEAQR